MSKIDGLTNTPKKIHQDIDLDELFDGALSGKPALRAKIGQAIIDTIIDRTEDNEDINGNSLKRYSKEYVGSKDFRRYGKSKSDINMTLKGDMMDALDIIKNKASSIRIGFDQKTQELKAANHNKGVTVPRRQFFGVTNKELKSIASEFKDVVDKIKKSKAPRSESLAEVSAAIDMLGNKKAQDDIFLTLFGADFEF